MTAEEIETLQIYEGQTFIIQDLENLYTLLLKPDQLSIYCGLIGIRKITMLYEDFDFSQNFNMKSFIGFLIKKVSNSFDYYEQYECLWILSNLACGNEKIIIMLEENGVLFVFVNALSSENEKIIGQGLWGLANIIIEKPQFRDSLINIGIMDKLRILMTKCDAVCREILLWTISNIFKTKPYLEFELFEKVFEELCFVLKEGKMNSEDLENVLSIFYLYSSNLIYFNLFNSIIRII